MSNKNTLKPLSVALGTAIALGLSTSPLAQADSSADPFAMQVLSSGYQIASSHDSEGKCGEAKCGANKAKVKEKAKEGACGSKKEKAKEGSCGSSKKKADTEGKCGSNK